MKLVVVGNEEESLGFSLAGIEGVVVEDELMFVETYGHVLSRYFYHFYFFFCAIRSAPQ